MFTTIVVPVDDTPDAFRALKPGRAIADATGAELIVASVVTSLQERAVRAVHVREKVEKAGVEVDKVITYVNAHAVEDGIAHFLERSDDTLIVAASHGHSHTAGLVGSTTEGLVHHWPGIAILLVGPHVDVDNYCLDGPLLACVDTSHESAAVIPPVARLAKDLLLKPWVVTVMEPLRVGAGKYPVAGGMEPTMESTHVHTIAGRIQAAGTEAVNWEVLHGKNPAKSIASFAKSMDASIIAMATRPRGGLSRIVYGSVAMDTVREAPCPVLAVHAEPVL